MASDMPVAGEEPGASVVLSLQPIHGRTKELWSLVLEPELLTISKPDGTAVVYLHQEEVARYVRLDRDVFRGRTIKFVIVEGLKSYSFRCTKEQFAQFVAWMPHKSDSDEKKEAWRSGLGVALMGIPPLILRQDLFWGCGVCLLAAGIVGIVLPKRMMHAALGILMILVGLWDLFPRQLLGLVPWSVPQDDLMIPVVMGSFLMLWGIHQISLLSANQLLRVARAIRDERMAFLPGRSRLVRGVGYGNIAGSVAFGGCAAGLLVAGLSGAGADTAPGGLASSRIVLSDSLVFAVLGVLMLSMAAAFLLRKRPAYLEAKASAQLLIAAGVFVFWGIVFHVLLGTPLSPFALFASDGLMTFARPEVWVSLVLCVLAFNWWFNHALDRELEEQRE